MIDLVLVKRDMQRYVQKMRAVRGMRVYVASIYLEKSYGSVNREALWQVLRMYDVGGVNF